MGIASRALNTGPDLCGFGSVSAWKAIRPLVLLAALFAAELVVLSVWLDTSTLSTQSLLLAGIGNYGSRVLRIVVAFSAIFFTFAFLRYRALPVSRPQIRWNLLGAHFVDMLVFAGLSSALFSGSGPLQASNPAAVCWLASGVSSIVLAAVAFIPMNGWMGMVRTTGSLWIYALSGAMAVAFASDIAKSMWRPLWNLTFYMVTGILGLFISPVLVNPATLAIQTPHFEVEVAPECAGFEGLGLILAFGIIFLILFRKECRFPQALLLLPAGLVAIYLMNGLRLAALILIGNAGAPQVALGGFHSQAGWITFALASLGFCFAARRVPWIAVQSVEKASAHQETNPSAAYLIPFLAILASGMAATALSAHFEWLYGLRPAAAAVALWHYRGSYRKLDWQFTWRGLSAGTILFFFWIALDRWTGTPAIRAMPLALASAPAALRIGWILVRALAAIVTVPIAEELAFRGFLMRRLAGPDFEAAAWRAVPWYALLISSLLFGLMHGQRWLAGTVAGLIFGWLAIRRERIGEAVAAHAATNLLIAVYVLAGGQWQLW